MTSRAPLAKHTHSSDQERQGTEDLRSVDRSILPQHINQDNILSFRDSFWRMKSEYQSQALWKPGTKDLTISSLDQGTDTSNTRRTGNCLRAKICNMWTGQLDSAWAFLILLIAEKWFESDIFQLDDRTKPVWPYPIMPESARDVLSSRHRPAGSWSQRQRVKNHMAAQKELYLFTRGIIWPKNDVKYLKN